MVPGIFVERDQALAFISFFLTSNNYSSMKTRFSLSQLWLALALLGTTFLVSCEKESLSSTNGAQEGLAMDPNGAYFEDLDGSLQQIDLESLGNDPELVLRNGNGNSHVNAHYAWQANSAGHGFYKSSTFQLNATENNQGISGVGHMWRTWGPEGEFAFHVIMDADCLDSNGEEAVFVGKVTQVEGETPLIYPQVGARVWLRVKDNGQGANAPLDQYKPAMIFNPSGTLPCEFSYLNGIFWNFFLYENVANESDNINVN